MLRVVRGQYAFHLIHGCIELDSSIFNKTTTIRGPRVDWLNAYGYLMDWEVEWTLPFCRQNRTGGWYCMLPLWVALVVVGTATLLLFWRECRRSPKGYCRICGRSLVDSHRTHCGLCLRWTRSFQLLLVLCSAVGFYALSPAMNFSSTTFYTWVTIMLGWPLFPIILQRVRGCSGMPEGYCQKCGYNLTGNVSGKCPECGLRVPPAVTRRSQQSL